MLGKANILPKPRGSRGNFDHLRWLLAQDNQPQAETPSERINRLCDKLARCPAAHNRALFGEEPS